MKVLVKSGLRCDCDVIERHKNDVADADLAAVFNTRDVVAIQLTSSTYWPLAETSGASTEADTRVKSLNGAVVQPLVGFIVEFEAAIKAALVQPTNAVNNRKEIRVVMAILQQSLDERTKRAFVTHLGSAESALATG